jgi:hypothetical protein
MAHGIAAIALRCPMKRNKPKLTLRERIIFFPSALVAWWKGLGDDF